MQYTCLPNVEIDTGDITDISGCRWQCIEPCTVIGVLNESGHETPILLANGVSARNTHQLVLDSLMRTNAFHGQPPMAARCLGPYFSVDADAIGRAPIIKSKQTPWLLILVNERSDYLIQEPILTSRGDVAMQGRYITMDDLRSLKLIDGHTFSEYRQEVENMAKASSQKLPTRIWRNCTSKLG